MKIGIHPQYFKNAKVTCSCGNVMTIGSTIEAYSTELCSKCHPFYTGKQKTVDSTGRIERFKAKTQQAESAKDQLSKKKERTRKTIEEKVNEELRRQIEKERKEDEKMIAKIRKSRGKKEAIL